MCLLTLPLTIVFRATLCSPPHFLRNNQKKTGAIRPTIDCLFHEAGPQKQLDATTLGTFVGPVEVNREQTDKQRRLTT